MSSTLLIEEVNPLLTESKKDKSGKWIMEGVFLQAAVQNRNKRIYPKEVLGEAVGKYHKEYITQNRALGELQHPTNRAKVDPSLAVIKIESIKEDGNNYHGKAIVLNTDQGRNLQALLEAGVKLGVSSRALGSIRESNGISVVQNDLELFAIDVVADPSAPDAWVSALMEEKETIFCPQGGCYMLTEELKKSINKASKNNLEEEILKAWKIYCNYLKL